MAANQLKVRDGVNGAEVVIDAAAETLTVDVEDLSNITVQAVQFVDAGTVVLHVEKSADGVVFVQLGANIVDTDFAAGVNVAVERTLSDANGMPIFAKSIRLRASALAAGGSYKLKVVGIQRPGFA